MFRVVLISLFLVGCASTNDKPLSTTNKESLGRIGVVSTLGDGLLCNYTGLTIFNNEEYTYEVPGDYNTLLTGEITKQLASLNLTSKALSRSSIDFIKENKGASKFTNIRLSQELKNSNSIDTLVIYDGKFHYKSIGGYYARDNALNTTADLYIYNISSGELMGKSSKIRTDLHRYFSCLKGKILPSSDMYILLRKAGLETQKELISNTFDKNTSKESI